MSVICLHEPHEIAELLDKDCYLNIYGLGDLDPLFWPRTTWYGCREEGSLKAAICVYAGPDVPTILALSQDSTAMAELIEESKYLLPCRFFAHLSPGLEELFRATHDFVTDEPHLKMALLDNDLLKSVDTSGVSRLEVEHVPQLLSLYNDSYPGNWFDPEMLKLSSYYGIIEDGRLVSAAGTHVLSKEYCAAAIGNITTRPESRNMGYGMRVSAALCKDLVRSGLRVGLNVHAENKAATACYEKIGFRATAAYSELTLRHKTGEDS